jgi:hypothetical protein
LKGKYFTFYQYYIISSFTWGTIFVLTSLFFDLMFRFGLRMFSKKNSFAKIKETESEADMQIESPATLTRVSSMELEQTNPVMRKLELILK